MTNIVPASMLEGFPVEGHRKGRNLRGSRCENRQRRENRHLIRKSIRVTGFCLLGDYRDPSQQLNILSLLTTPKVPVRRKGAPWLRRCPFAPSPRHRVSWSV